MLLSRFSLVCAIGACAATVACGSTSPVAPGSSSFFGRGGAVITGHVNGAPVRATAQAVTAEKMATPTTVTVTIVGTDVTSVVDGLGNFELTGVPPGDVELRFAGNGSSATIKLQGVAAGDRIHIVVTLNGNDARIDDEDRDNDDEGEDEDDDEAEVKGVVSGLSGSCQPVVTLTFTVQSTKVLTNPMTRFEVPCAQIVTGMRLEVEGVRQADGSIVAKEVDRD